MAIEYIDIRRMLNKRRINYPDFSIFNDRGTIIKAAYWQPKGDISFDPDRGFFSNAKVHEEKAKAFLNLARQEKADIVIAPEYSFPWSVVEKLFENTDLWPKNGKLWCLGLEGINCDELEDYYNRYRQQNNIFFEMEDINELNQNSFLSCIGYFFYSGKKLICIIQFKTTAASDQWVQLEAGGLTTGNRIYYFKDTKTNHCLFSYICADALNQNISKVKEQVQYQKCIILHPQLNPKPLHDSFCQMRKSYLDYSDNNIRILSVNWAKDTILKGLADRKDIKVESNYTAFYNNPPLYNFGVKPLLSNIEISRL